MSPESPRLRLLAPRPRRCFFAIAIFLAGTAALPATATTLAVARRNEAASPRPLEPALALSGLIATALRIHPDIRSASASARAQVFRVNGARSVYYPQVALQGGITETNAVTSTQIGITPFTEGNAGLSASWDVYAFGKNESTVDQAQIQAKLGRIAYDQARLDVTYAVRQAYVDWVETRSLVTEQLVQVQNSRQLYDEALAFYRHGTRAWIDVTSAQAALASASASYVVDVANERIARHQLADAVGIPALPTGTPAFPPVPAVAAAAEPALLSQAESSPAVASARTQVQLARQEEQTADRTGLPDVAVSGSYGARSRGQQVAPSWSGGVTLSVPLFSGFGVVSSRDAAHQLTLAAQETLANARLQTHLAVSRAYLTLAGARQQVPAAEAAERAAKVNLDQAEGRYREGVGSIIEVSDAEAQYADAQAATIRTLAAYQLAIADLLHATGHLGVSS